MYIDLIKTLIDRITLASDSYLMQGTVHGSFPGLQHKRTDKFSQSKLSNQLYSTLHLLLCLIKNKKIKQHIDTYFTRSFAKTLVETLLDLIKSYVISLKKDRRSPYSQSNQNDKKVIEKDGTNNKEEDLRLFWPTWLSPFCVLLYELIIAPIGISEMQTMLLEIEVEKQEKLNQNNHDKQQNRNDDSGRNGGIIDNWNKNKHQIDDSDEEKTENCIEEEKENETVFQSENNDGEGKQKDEIGKGYNNLDEESAKGSKSSERGSGKDFSIDSSSEAELALELGTLLSAEVNRSSLLPELSWQLIYETVFSILKSASLFSTISDSNDENVFSRRKKSTVCTEEYESESQNQIDSLKDEKSTKSKSPHELPEIRYLDPSSNQGVLLLVHTLLSKRNLSARFVASSGKCK